MPPIDALLDKCKQRRSIASDNALAKVIGVGRAAVSTWRHGTRFPDTVACARIADLSGEPLARVLGVVGEARALSKEEKAIWRKLAGIAAAVAVLALPGLLLQQIDGHQLQAFALLFVRPELFIMRTVAAAAMLLLLSSTRVIRQPE